jgi:hypothetical protein
VITDSGEVSAAEKELMPDPPLLHQAGQPFVERLSALQDGIELGLSRGRNAMAIRQELVVAQIFLLFNEGMF